MPAYNSEDYISEAMNSVLNQTYNNFEFVILDDNSTDNTWKIIKEYPKKNKRIRIHRNDKNINIVKTRNKLFKLASSDTKYYAIFDSDDISMNTRLGEQVKFLEKNPEYGAVGSHTYIINENSKIIAKRRYLTEYNKIKKNLLIKSPFAQPSVMIRKSVIDNVGMYNKTNGYNRSRDYDLWLRIADKYKIKNLDKYLFKYRVYPSQGKQTQLQETLLSTIQIQKKWIFKKRYFSIKALINLFFEYFLLLLPEEFVFKLFKELYYK